MSGEYDAGVQAGRAAERAEILAMLDALDCGTDARKRTIVDRFVVPAIARRGRPADTADRPAS